jgi:hypothetical protein
VREAVRLLYSSVGSLPGNVPLSFRIIRYPCLDLGLLRLMLRRRSSRLPIDHSLRSPTLIAMTPQPNRKIGKAIGSRAVQSRSIYRAPWKTGSSRAPGRHIRTWTRVRLGPSEDDLVRDLRFYLQRYSFANRRMSFGFVKISVKIALLNAPNISGLDAATKYFFVMTAVNAEESRISNEVAYTVNTSSTL